MALPNRLPDVSREPGFSKHMGTRQCVSMTKDGERCGNAPIRGGTVCVLHGGASPSAQRAAKMRLLATVEPAIETLFLAIARCKFEPVNAVGANVRCVVHGEDGCPEWPVRVNAAKALLDRSGHGPQAKLTLEQNTEDLSQLGKAAIAAELDEIARQLRVSNAIDISATSSETFDTPQEVDNDPPRVNDEVTAQQEATG